MNANRGYVGWSKSARACAAEDNGLLPLSRIGAGRYIKAAAKVLGAAEWHHTSKYFNRTDYFDARAIRALAAQMKSTKRDAASIAALRDARKARRWYGTVPQSAALRDALRLLRDAAALDAGRPVSNEYAWRDRARYAAEYRFEAHAVIRRALGRPHLRSSIEKSGERVTRYEDVR